MANRNAYRSTVALKVAMAVTGLAMFVFVVFHLYGNLKMFLGPDVINHYAAGLRHLGDPIFSETHLLWLARLGLIGTVALHLYAAVALTLRSRAARPLRYTRHEHIALSYASSAMLWGGLWLGGFVIFHLLHLTFGLVGPEPQVLADGHVDVYANVVRGFQSPLVSTIYIASMVPLGFHLYHGLWSATQTLGAATPQLNVVRRPAALLVAVAIVAGYVSIPVAVLVGVLR